MGYEYDPAKEPCSPNYRDYDARVDRPGLFDADGPGGRTTNVENNEKGILETGLFEIIGRDTKAIRPSDHDGFKQGIYRA